DSVSGYCDVWKVDAFDDQRAGSAAGSAGTRGGGVSLPQALYADAASLVCADGSAASFAVCNGGWAHAEGQVRQGSDQHGFLGTEASIRVARSEDGGHSAAAIRSGSAD